MNLRQEGGDFEDLEPECTASSLNPCSKLQAWPISRENLWSETRPETEELVIKKHSRFRTVPVGNILEIGVGTGCIILSLERLVGRRISAIFQRKRSLLLERTG